MGLKPRSAARRFRAHCPQQPWELPILRPNEEHQVFRLPPCVGPAFRNHPGLEPHRHHPARLDAVRGSGLEQRKLVACAGAERDR
eukprot:1989302-Rhodomonas_salina.1